MKRLLFAATILTLLGVPLYAATAVAKAATTPKATSKEAAEFDGIWTRQMKRRGETLTETLDLTADGKKLTGTLQDFRGGALPISHGKIDGKKVSFKVVRKNQNRSITEDFKGSVEGNQLTLKRSIEGGPGAGAYGRRAGGGGFGGGGFGGGGFGRGGFGGFGGGFGRGGFGGGFGPGFGGGLGGFGPGFGGGFGGGGFGGRRRGGLGGGGNGQRQRAAQAPEVFTRQSSNTSAGGATQTPGGSSTPVPGSSTQVPGGSPTPAPGGSSAQ